MNWWEFAGDLPTWIGGVGAVLAGVFAYKTLASQREQIGEQRAFIEQQTGLMADQRETLELEREELRAAADDRRKAQARQVHMVFAPPGYNDGSLTWNYGRPVGHDRWAVKVSNRSTDAIYEVTVLFGDGYTAASAQELDAGAHPDRGVRSVPVLLIAGMRTVRFESPLFSEMASAEAPPRPELLFTDNLGKRWRRDSYGDLKPVPGDPLS